MKKKFLGLSNPHDYRQLPINKALDFYDIEHISFEEWLQNEDITFENATEGDIDEYYAELAEGANRKLILRMVEEVFYITFLNRDMLKTFNEMIADVIANISLDNVGDTYKKHFKDDGKLKRKYMPTWVKNAVYFRENGKCAFCNEDLSGNLSPHKKREYDHIVPLAKGGINDLSNIQLLCKICNRKKRAGEPTTSKNYERWYPIEIT